ncbi:MAG: Ig-like domain-containing protein, partial [Chloroflexi bacterium]|nr:Ig-like domain-containing protein [Chloroflexota bacterium]
AKADTTLSLITNQNPSPYGIPVLATAYVTGNDPSTAVPVSGTVQFYIDGVAYGAPVKVGSDGSASKLLPYTALWVGTHSVTAVYSGDANFNGSDNTADPLMQVVEKGSLTVLLDFTADAPVFGQAFGMTATFTGDGPNVPLPTGTLQFSIDGADLGVPIDLDAAATAISDLIDSLAVGAHAVTLSYSGDDTYAAAVIDIPSAIAVLKADTSIAITGWLPDSGLVVGQALTVTFDVSVTAPGAGAPTGAVTVSNGIDSCFASLADGSCQLSPTFSGVQQLTAVYSGDGSFNSSSTAAPVEGPTYDKAATAVTVVTGVNPQGLGLPVSFTAAVQAEAPGGGVPDGMVQFKVDDVELGSPVTLINGSAASESITDLATGLHTVTAHYLGSSGYLESDSAQLPQRIVEGCLGTATPEAGGLLICTGTQNVSLGDNVNNGLPVTTTIEIPAGAVASKVTLVYNRLDGSLLAPPAGTDFVSSFTLDVYIESALQSAYTFTTPISITMSYIPDNWDTDSFMALGWDGSAWSANGLAITSNNPDEQATGFTMQNVGAQEYALTGEHEYLLFVPFFIH